MTKYYLYNRLVRNKPDFLVTTLLLGHLLWVLLKLAVCYRRFLYRPNENIAAIWCRRTSVYSSAPEVFKMFWINNILPIFNRETFISKRHFSAEKNKIWWRRMSLKLYQIERTGSFRGIISDKKLFWAWIFQKSCFIPVLIIKREVSVREIAAMFSLGLSHCFTNWNIKITGHQMMW